MQLINEIRSEAHFAAMLYNELEKGSEVAAALFASAGFEQHPKEKQCVLIEPNLIRDAWAKADALEQKRLLSGMLEWSVDNGFISQQERGIIERNYAYKKTFWGAPFWRDHSQEVNFIKQIFYTRPDMLVLARGKAVWIELKVESGLGVNQLSRQARAADVSRSILPETQEYFPIHLLITLKDQESDRVTALKSVPQQFRDRFRFATWEEIAGSETQWRKHGVLFSNPSLVK